MRDESAVDFKSLGKRLSVSESNSWSVNWNGVEGAKYSCARSDPELTYAIDAPRSPGDGDFALATVRYPRKRKPVRNPSGEPTFPAGIFSYYFYALPQ
jgi:hypothetical protein